MSTMYAYMIQLKTHGYIIYHIKFQHLWYRASTQETIQFSHPMQQYIG